MSSKFSFFDIKRLPAGKIPLSVQRDLWLRKFMEPFFVMCLAYTGIYFLRYNFKAATPFIIEQTDFTLSDLGTVGFGFSITYSLGRVLLSYYIDGKNTKKILSFLLMLSCASSFAIGMFLLSSGHSLGIFIFLWALTGLFQAPGGPCSNSTINRWTPRKNRGRFISWWNASHNIGAILAGPIALFGMEYAFNGNVAGMFIFPILFAGVIATFGMFFGKDDPSELGWNTPEEIFDEPVSKDDTAAEAMSKSEIFVKYVLKNPAVWFLCFANLCVYTIRIGVDNWSVAYVKMALSWDDVSAIGTITALELGGFLGSLTWGYVSDKMGGRRALLGMLCMISVIFPLVAYQNMTSVWGIYIALFFEGFFIFGPVILIGISIIGFAPKCATAVVNSIPGFFGYLFGDGMAKVLVSRIADPKGDGISVGSLTLHGWSDTFYLLFAATALGIVMLGVVAIYEERKIRRDRANGH
ncbi:hexose-6-phosphate:phosphate antiporter [Providencia manganoxydans]|uniref:Hexose-6-phosphate:phosphate antiporter n=2 Tax=Providencia manganoxydans TaxID=2923283 RepID=A0ABX7AFW7_9GAMM|nr:hexose-6-phosphate:phosphate antiporter [Providencia manganoxydans]HEF8774872.1 hexose-6-phosphate:phosphate antiporter [Providencia stuartii]